METVAVGPKSRRGRKRKIDYVQNVMINVGGKKLVVETKPLKLVDRYVRKDFEGNGVLLGRILLYDSGLYRIMYEDEHCEDLVSSNVKAFLVEDSDLTGEWAERKEKLNELLSSKDVNTKDLTMDDRRELENDDSIDSSLLSEMTNCDSVNDETVEVHNGENGDVLTGSCEGNREGEANLDMGVPLVPPPELPPSSGNIVIPEEYVSHLLSVYGFLRSFSLRLFLHPFGLDDFVGALNCSVTNTLLDSVHVALMRVLKRHFERLLPDGSELASKVLGFLDWSLLDTLTWPIYLIHYLIVMGYKNEWKEFYTHCLERDYYTLPSGKKLIVLQILCEDVLDTEELRAEMDMRKESEVGIDIDLSTTGGTICEPERVRPGYSETSACKDVEAVESVEKHHETKCYLGNHPLESQVGGVGNSIHEDGNGDECRLCGMDGLLVCCDGCPSCYHSRCIGISKMYMPEGSWYCPECKINATEPKILQGTALRGGDIFGVDPYNHVYLASCDYLLVLNISFNSDNGLRYYNRLDIPGVLHALSSKDEHAIMYSEICGGIMEYWELPPGILSCNKMPNKVGTGQCSTQLVNFLDKVPKMTEVENQGSCVAGSCADLGVSQLASCADLGVSQLSSENSLETVTIFDQHIVSMGQQCEIMKITMTKPALFSSLIGQHADPCELSQQKTSSATNTVPSRTSNVKYNDPLNGFLEAKTSLLSQQLNSRVDKEAYESPQNQCLYMGSSFKTTGYINHYLHGDFAASAAANLAILSCKEHEISKSRSSDDQQKVTGASIALQAKAFSSAAMRFFWPNTEKKLVEVPRERCGWCLSCKAAVTSKRACLLNAAASNAIRGATKVVAGVRPLKNVEDGRLSGIGAYIMYMEESLSGLLIGPFLSDKFRKQWRKQVEQATSCNGIKILLLELEENVRPIALSGDWMKLVEGISTEFSASQIVATASESTLKHRPGRRGRKHSVVAEVAVGGCQDKVKLNSFTWWRGGRLSKLMFQKGILPCAIIKKSARQGGRKKIPGIHYVEGNEIAKSSRQLVWRSAVEMSMTLAQLALQVRNLDFHVRWADLVRPEQTLFDGKGPEAEASNFFRNASICDKKIVEHKIRYCVAFGSQKHLPSRIMKNVTEIEQILDHGNERYWFSESHIPLYLIREYEQKVDKNKPMDVISKLRKRQLKSSRENIFSFLSWKQENTARNCCSCHQDVLYRNAAKCSACQGFCHNQCDTSSTVNLNEGVEFPIIPEQCSDAQSASLVEKSKHGSPANPILLQEQDFQNPATVTKLGKLVGSKGPSASRGALEHSSEVKSTNRSSVTNRRRKSNWGLMWRKINCEDTGIDFRLKNILLRGNADSNSIKPLCRLCDQPYNADLMYIRCDTCTHWFHADSVELDESKIFSVVGFKCCKCRKVKSPVCPYLDPVKKRALADKTERQQTTKQKISDLKKTSNFSNSIEKIPIRRSMAREANIDCCSATNSFRTEASSLSETNAVSSIQRIASMEKVDDGSTLTSDCLGSDDTEFNPETTFSLNGFLKSDDGGYANGNTSTENGPPTKVFFDQEKPIISDVRFDPVTIFSLDEFLESDDGGYANGNESTENGPPTKVLCDQEKPIISGERAAKIEPCKLCSNIESSADLCCQICDMWIHRGCSPWFESSSDPDDEWRCGSCREWR